MVMQADPGLSMEHPMGEVILFSVYVDKVKKPSRRHTKGPWLFEQLNGRRPANHPKNITYNTRGVVFLAKGQVWVNRKTRELWVIKKLVRMRKNPPFPYSVHIGKYGRNICTAPRRVDETIFRTNFEIWDEFTHNHEATILNLQSQKQA